MIEAEKAYLRELKRETIRTLCAALQRLYTEYEPLLSAADPRIFQYIRQVITENDRHNLYELLKIQRFFAVLKRNTWKPDRVQRFFRFYETLRFSGVNGRQRYRLTPVQAFQFGALFGLARPDGRRLIRTAYIFVPRKFSKTTSAAALAVYDLLFGDNNAEAYIGANSYDQAKKCFNEVRALMFDIDPSQRHFRINRESITFKDHARDSFVQCLTANAKTKDGLSASLAILDEYAQARNTATKNGADLKNVLTTSMGARREPMTIIITTASDVIDGPCYRELETVKRVLRGEVEGADSMFADLFMPDIDDREDDPATWRKVQPHIGVTVEPDYYVGEWETAQLSEENRLAFRTKLLNLFAENATKTWFTFEQARDLCGRFDIDRVTGRPICAVAFDLSVRDDFSAVSYTFYNQNDKRFYAHTDYYFPDGALRGHPNERLYREWAEAGHLRLCDGEKIDVRRIANDILDRAKKVNIVRIGYDAYKSQELVNILSTVGGREVLHSYSQTYGSFNLPVESFEMLVYEQPSRIVLNDNPINAFCLSNCVLDTDRLENKKPIKISQFRKIDGTITMLMTLGQLYTFER